MFRMAITLLASLITPSKYVFVIKETHISYE